MDNSDDKPSCPFCTFSVPSSHERDMYALMQHLELSHPENGTSPFIVVSEDEEPYPRPRAGREGAPVTVTPPQDDEAEEVYIECPAQCGEAITLTDLSSHMELHNAEEMASDDAARPRSRDVSPQLLGSRSSSRPGSRPGSRSTSRGPPEQSAMAVYGDSLSASPPSSKKLHTHAVQRKQKDSYRFSAWKEFIWGPATRKTRSTHSKSRSSTPRRLGRTELGPHAYEELMPTWLRKQIERGAPVTVTNQITSSGKMIRVETIANETPGIVPVLAQLCEQDPALSKVFLCHPGVKHVVKMAREGGFCGYRNIQMMVSYIQASRSDGYEHFPGRIPSILDLQDLIEQAWDKGINASGRIETGGIRGTRKYIGTPEAQALLCSLNIGCEANAFNKTPDTTDPVYESVLQAVFNYFSIGVSDPSEKIYQTNLPPIYFQHPGHSLTIVGLEIRKSGSANLLVLDPMFKTSPGISRLVGARFRTTVPERLLKAYRRGGSYLSRYGSFEILKLDPPPRPEPRLEIGPS